MKRSWIQDYIHVFSDFPTPGIQFQWYAHLLRDPIAFRQAVKELAAHYTTKSIDVLVGLDSRGFILSAALAYEMQLPLVLIRKLGKLPGDTIKIEYDLEYGRDSLEIERESLRSGQRVVIVDDIIATGGTAAAACLLVERLDAVVVEVACLAELTGLKGRDKILRPVFSLLPIDVM